MTNILIGHSAHPVWSALAQHCDISGTWTEAPDIAADDRVVLLVGYEHLAEVDAYVARLPPLDAASLLVVAPDVPLTSALGRSLGALATRLPKATRLLHAPPIEALFAVEDDLRGARTLSLSLPERPVPLVAWPDVAEAASMWWRDGADTNELLLPARHASLLAEVLLAGPAAHDGASLAALIGRLLDDVLTPERFVALRLRELDDNGDGIITVDEATNFLMGLGHAGEAAAAMVRAADIDGDGTISLDEFKLGLDDQLAQVLAEVPRTVQWHRTLPHLLRDRWVERGRGFGEAHALAEHLATTRSQSEAATIIGARAVGDIIGERALGWVDIFVLPGRGLLSRREGRFGDATPHAPELLWRAGDVQLDQPASFTHLATVDGAHLDTRRSRQGAVEARWRGVGTTERLSYGEGDDARVLELDDGRLVGVACRGRWTGLRDTMVDLMARRPIRGWERALFRELGALHLEHAEEVVDPQEMVCHCVRVRRKSLVAAAESGCKTVAAIAERTRATSVCGGCTPIVEEILGSPKLKVAEVLRLEKLGNDFVTVALAPVEGEPLPSLAGQHVVLQARVQDRWITRAYSLTSPGGQAIPYEITVKREEMGLFSRWLSDRAGRDSLFRCSAPTGHVHLAPDEAGPIVVFAGGIGITPGIAIARTLAADGSGRRLHLDWSARRPGDFVFEAELDAIAAAHPTITWTRRLTPRDGRVTAESIAAHGYVPGALAFVCGPDRYGADVVALLRTAGWPAEAIRIEVFSSKVDDEGNVRSTQTQTPKAATRSDVVVPPVQHTSFFLDLRDKRPVLLEAEAFLGQMYRERGLELVLQARLEEVREELGRTGTYTHTLDELTFGARLAWRNATRCVGRFFWNHLVVRDMRHLEREEDIFAAIVDHIRLATNGGDLISTMTVFRPGAPDIRIYNTQLLRYAGYRQPDGGVIGDPANVELTEQALALGWTGPGTRFDILPLIIRIGDRAPRWFEIPPDAILRIPLSHPTLPVVRGPRPRVVRAARGQRDRARSRRHRLSLHALQRLLYADGDRRPQPERHQPLRPAPDRRREDGPRHLELFDPLEGPRVGRAQCGRAALVPEAPGAHARPPRGVRLLPAVRTAGKRRRARGLRRLVVARAADVGLDLTAVVQERPAQHRLQADVRLPGPRLEGR